MGPKPRPLEERFSDKWIVEPFSGCWLWIGARIGNHYGAIKFRRQKFGAHIASWILHKGEVPEGMHVCHKCDVPACVNPDHLFLATQKENNRDCLEKRRHAWDERNTWSKLTNTDAQEILNSEMSDEKLGLKFGVTAKTVRRIRNGETWKYLKESICRPNL